MTSVIYILTLKITHQKLTCLSRLQSALDEIKNAWWWAKNKPNIPGNVKVVSHTVMEMFNSFITTHPLESCLCLDTVKDVWFKFPLRGGLVELSLSAVLTCKQIFYLVCVLTNTAITSSMLCQNRHHQQRSVLRLMQRSESTVTSVKQ